ncbi:MAG: peptidylprolyl isomerase [Ferroplasma sp.]
MTNVVLETSLGDIEIELFDNDMPVTAGNFKKLVEQGFYNNTIFHRVIPDFMIQGGDPTGTGMGGPGYKIKDEFSKNNKNDRGTIAMANAGPNTGGSQFFINVVNNNYLDKMHPVFGKVVKGLDVADKISKVKRDRNDKPVEKITIKKARIK